VRAIISEIAIPVSVDIEAAQILRMIGIRSHEYVDP
jgi:hypothetical protein